MKAIKNKGGMTLVEVIIAIAILGIIAITFLGVFTSAFSGVITAGKYSQSAYSAQKAMENYIAGVDISTLEHISSSTSSTSVTIMFDEVSNPVVINGNLIQIDYDDSKHKVKLSTFIPTE